MKYSIPKNNIYKYIILILIIYYILKIIPEEQLKNQKSMNNIILLVIGFIIFDYLFIKRKSLENFAFDFIQTPQILNESMNTLIKQEDMSDHSIANRYYTSLITELTTNGILTKNDLDNIKLKLDTKILNINDVIISLELLKKSGKPKTMQTINNDHIYNELPSDFFEPIGKGVEAWANDYVLLNTDKWRVPMPRPPICVNTSACTVYPTEPQSLTFLKSWDDHRIISSNQINKKWINNQVVA